MARRMPLIAVLPILAIAAAAYGALHYMTSVPGRPHLGALPPLTPEEAALAQSLKQHIATIAAREHNVAHYDELEKVARYIEATLASFGYAVDRQEFLADGKMVRNIDVTVEPAAQNADPEVIVVGAHYDSVSGSPALVRKTMRSCRSHPAFPTIGGVAPGFVPGIGWSDHWAFAEHGFQAVMVTDTAPFRYPHYHRPSDTPDKVDAAKVARVVKGMERVIRDLSR